MKVLEESLEANLLKPYKSAESLLSDQVPLGANFWKIMQW